MIDMLVSPELSAEIDELLPKTQEELVYLAKGLDEQLMTMPTGKTLTEIVLSVGDIDLLVRKYVTNRR